jgi:hypothetical protein
MVTVLKKKFTMCKRNKFLSFWYHCYYFFTLSKTYFLQLEILLINQPSYTRPKTGMSPLKTVTFIYLWFIFSNSFIPLPCAECDNSMLFSGASSIPLCYLLFPATPLHQLFFIPPSLHLAIYFLVYLLVLLIPNLYTILFWEFYFLPFSVHVQTNIICVALLCLLW